MFQIQDSTFTEEIPATPVSAAWLNAVQESLCEILREAKVPIPKAIEYKKEHYKLLLNAIKTLVTKETNYEVDLNKQSLFKFNLTKITIARCIIVVLNKSNEKVFANSSEIIVTKFASTTKDTSQAVSVGEALTITTAINNDGSCIFTFTPDRNQLGYTGKVYIRILEER